MSSQTSTQFFYGRHGERFGPFEAKQLRILAATGRLQPTDMVWREGLPEWVQASRVKGLFPKGQAQTRARQELDSTLPKHESLDSRHEPGVPESNVGAATKQSPKARPKVLKYTPYALLVVVLLGSLLAYRHYTRGPVAIENFADAVSRSKETGQDVLFVFTAPWCGACNVMKTALLKNPDLFEGRILCLIDYDTNPDLVKEHEVESIPTYGIWRDDQILKKRVGYPGIKNLRTWLDE